MSTLHVQLIVDQNTVPLPLQTALSRLKARVSIRSMDKAMTSGVSPTADVCVILPGQQGPSDVLDRILSNASDRACATMILPPSEPAMILEPAIAGRLSKQRLRQESDDALNADELTGRIKALCEIRHPLQKMREELDRLREKTQQLSTGAQIFDEQIHLASQIQNDLLPDPLENTDPLRIETLYLPADYVSGDIYEIARLDEEHLGFSLADATGHGLPAALLTIFIKKSLRGKEIIGDSYRIFEPAELLERLNQDLLLAGLKQCQFVTALHAVFNTTTREIRWARGGAPYPILLRPGEYPRQLRSSGGLIGAFEEQSFETASHVFEPGDTLLLYTDGLDSLLLSRDRVNSEQSILNSPWLDELAVEGPQTALQTLREIARKQSPSQPTDDITILTLKMDA